MITINNGSSYFTYHSYGHDGVNTLESKPGHHCAMASCRGGEYRISPFPTPVHLPCKLFVPGCGKGGRRCSRHRICTRSQASLQTLVINNFVCGGIIKGALLSLSMRAYFFGYSFVQFYFIWVFMSKWVQQRRKVAERSFGHASLQCPPGEKRYEGGGWLWKEAHAERWWS